MLQVPKLLSSSFRDLKHGYWTNGSSHVPVCRLCTVYTSLLLKPKQMKDKSIDLKISPSDMQDLVCASKLDKSAEYEGGLSRPSPSATVSAVRQTDPHVAYGQCKYVVQQQQSNGGQDLAQECGRVEGALPEDTADHNRIHYTIHY